MEVNITNFPLPVQIGANYGGIHPSPDCDQLENAEYCKRQLTVMFRLGKIWRGSMLPYEL